MASEFQDSVSLLETARKEGLYSKLILQLHKDFSLANTDIHLTSDMEATQLETLLREKIYYLILEKFEDYLNLLYLIDVPERAFKDLRVTDVVEVADQMTFLVLQRELQKVRLKAKYS